MARLRHIPALDGVRGLAVLAILLFHAEHIVGGWLGVDLFFVLSGFLITSLLLVEHASSGRIRLGAFWERRARRLLPALLATLLGVAGYAAFFAAPQQRAAIRADAFATLAYVANWRAIWVGSDYWSLFLAPSPLDHTWSLAIEEQFYLLWPPAVVFLLVRKGWSPAAVGRFAAGAALLSAAWMGWLYDPVEGTSRVYYGTDTRVSALLIGALLATSLHGHLQEVSRSHAPGWARWVDALGLVALVLLGIAWWRVPGNAPWLYPGGLFALNALAALVIASPVLAPQGLSARVLSIAPLRGLGLVSYGVYLWHWPIYLVLSPERAGVEGGPLTALRIAATLAVSAASYSWLEQPVRRGALAPRATLGAAGAGVALVVAVLAIAAPSEPRASKVPPRRGPVRLDVVLIGDSAAQSVADAFRRQAHARELAPLVVSRPGCVVVESGDLHLVSNHEVWELAEGCEEQRQRWRSVARERKPRMAILFEGWAGNGKRRLGEAWHHPCQPAYDEAHRADLLAAVALFRRGGGEVALVHSVVPDTARTPFVADESEGEIAERNACLNATRREVAAQTGAVLIELDRWVDAYEGDLVLREDGLHFRAEAAELVVGFMLGEAAGLLE